MEKTRCVAAESAMIRELGTGYLRVYPELSERSKIGDVHGFKIGDVKIRDVHGLTSSYPEI